MLGRETRKAKDVQFVDLTADDEEYVDKPALLSVSKPAPFTQARLCKSNLGEAESKTSVNDGEVDKQLKVEIERLCASAHSSHEDSVTRRKVIAELKEKFGERVIQNKMSLVNDLLASALSKIGVMCSPANKSSSQKQSTKSLRDIDLELSDDEEEWPFLSRRDAIYMGLLPRSKTKRIRFSAQDESCSLNVPPRANPQNSPQKQSMVYSGDRESSGRERVFGTFRNPVDQGFESMSGIKRKRKSDDEDSSDEDDEDDEDEDDDDDNLSSRRDEEEFQTGEDYMDDDVGLSHTDAQEQTFTSYLPPTCSHPCLVAHPDELVETSSLASVSEPKVVHRLRLPSKTLLDGLLTRAQAEVCLRAVAQHELRLPNGHRSGFFMGDGAGVGKGRQQAAIIFHNFLHGRRKALWISISADLIDDARRDISDIGAADLLTCHNLKSYRIGQRLPIDSGVLFCTYSLLVSQSGQNSRKEQIIEWCGDDFDGVIALDECHRAKNLDKSSGSKAARAVQELQDRLPMARVVYVSATGVTEPEHLACLSRLGLWGIETAFPTVDDFVKDIKKGGVGAMELCAMHMKTQGQYLARSLSFRGATFEIIKEDLPEDFITMYDACTVLWSRIVAEMNSPSAGLSGIEARQARSRMWNAHQRFWAQMCMAAKVKPTVEAAEEALRHGCCVVIGLQNTGESVTTDVGSKGQQDEPASSSESIVRQFLAHHCNSMSDSARSALLGELSKIKLPNNPLDEIIFRLGGPTKVAEMTGRKHRYEFVKGKWVYVSRTKDRISTDSINVFERKKFQTGEKLVAIISEAASTGISLQADRRARNHRRRVHITLQLPWSAEKAVQQMGRTHRSNQISAPAFKLMLSPIGGEWRFASTVANRLQSLGALTQGDRRAAGASSAMRSFSIEPKYGLNALDQLQDFIFCCVRNEFEVPEFIIECYSSIDNFCGIAFRAMKGVGLGPGEGGRGCRLKRFMNRLFGLSLQLQTHIFDLFLYLLGARIAAAKAANKYSEGIVDLFGDIELKEESDLYVCPRTGAIAKYFKISTDRGISWDKALTLLTDQREDESGFYRSVGSKEYFVLALKKSSFATDSSMCSGFFHLVRPNTGFSPVETHRSDLLKRYRKVSPSEAKNAWETLHARSEIRCGHSNQERCAGATCSYQRRMHFYHIVAGMVLPFWKQIAQVNKNMKVVRISVQQRRIVGINIFPSCVENVKALISQGLKTSVRMEARLKDLPESPFLIGCGQALLIHDCLSTDGVENLNLSMNAGLSADTILFARFFEIPVSSDTMQAVECPKILLKEVAWKFCPSLYLNGQILHVPPALQKSSCPLVLDRKKLRIGDNSLKIISTGVRLFLVIQAGRKRSIREVMDLILARKPITAFETQELLQKICAPSLSNDIQVVSDISISFKCPLSMTRISIPCRGTSCVHAQSFDLENFLAFAERFGCWACPVCEKQISLDELRRDELTMEALRMQPDADSFSFGPDGLSFSLADSSLSFVTPETAKKATTKEDNPADNISSEPVRRLDDALDGSEARISFRALQQGAFSGKSGLLESGIWENFEEAETIFTLPSRPCSDDELEHSSEDSASSPQNEMKGKSGLRSDLSETDEGDGGGMIENENGCPSLVKSTAGRRQNCSSLADSNGSSRTLRARVRSAIKYAESSVSDDVGDESC